MSSLPGGEKQVRREISEASRKWEQKARTSKKERKWQRGVVTHPLSESQWNRCLFSMKKWSLRSTKAGACQQKASRPTWPQLGEACAWAVVQLDYDEDMEPLHGMYGSMEADYEVQRTIKRADLTAFLFLLKKVIGPIKVHVGNTGKIDGLRKGEKECIKP